MLCFVQRYPASSPCLNGSDAANSAKDGTLRLKAIAKQRLLRKTKSANGFSNATHNARSAPATPLCGPPDNAPLPMRTTSALSTSHVQRGRASPPCTAATVPILRSPSHSSTRSSDRNLKPQATSHSPASPGGHSKTPGSSKARQKKFHRHFQQVAEEERVINYYSCALVSDILLQGHLYITNNYFAFYSNVFGFVTKLLIPIASVLKISKEKTARIIPNAVGVATLDEKHVFGSFMSRDAAHRLMLQVWRAARPVADEEISGQDIIRSGDLECSECSADDYSSGSGSGTESPPVPLPVSVASPVSALCRTAARPRALKGAAPAIPSQAHHTQNGATSTVATDHGKRSGSTLLTIIDSMPRHTLLLVVSTALLALLFISAGVLLYRIGQVHHRAHLRGLESSGGEDLYGEVLRWQAELHSQSASEVQNVLDSHLHQIAKVRQSLEALSMLIVSEEASQNKHTSNS